MINDNVAVELGGVLLTFVLEHEFATLFVRFGNDYPVWAQEARINGSTAIAVRLGQLNGGSAKRPRACQ